MNQSRQPAGVPAGGQFAATARTESGVVLGGPVSPGEDGETLVREFSCEHHDEPGACTTGCTDLVAAMDTDMPDDMPYDPTGCHDGPDRPYRTYEYDETAKASICITHVPEPLALARALQKGQWVYVEGEPRKVDSVDYDRARRRVYVDFEGFDKDPDGTPEAYFSRTMSGEETLVVVSPDDIPQF